MADRHMTDQKQLNEDAVIACVDLVGRAGARQFEIGYLRDDVPVEGNPNARRLPCMSTLGAVT